MTGQANQRSNATATKQPVPLWRWATWWAILGVALVLFYVILTPLWLGLRGLAWLAELRARKRR